MAEIDHWNAVLTSRELRDQPKSIRVAGRNIVVFRTETGALGAIDDACVHRRMRLSTGCIVGEKLQCPYHGWTFGADGCGESPGTPKMHATTTHYDVREAHGAIWMKSAESTAAFPEFNIDGYYFLGAMSHLAQAPLETTLDNFCEVEHTPTTHAMFGYRLERMHEVTTHTEATDTTVRVVTDGPHKPLPWYMRTYLGLYGDTTFTDDWTTHFSPVHTIFDHSFRETATGRDGRVRWRLFLFFTPKSENETLVTTIAFIRAQFFGPYGGARLLKPLILRFLEKEVALDCRILANLADKNPQLEGMKLSRFDRALGLNRERIEKVFRGRPTIAAESMGAVPINKAS